MSAKIYCIECKITGEKYIGSTIHKLSRRISKHKFDKTCRSRHIIQRGNYIYYLIEEVEESQKLIREQFWMDNTDNIINLKRADGYDTEKRIKYMKQYSKTYSEVNRDKLLKYQKELHEYKNSWGGDKRTNNNLLLIDVLLFK